MNEITVDEIKISGVASCFVNQFMLPGITIEEAEQEARRLASATCDSHQIEAGIGEGKARLMIDVAAEQDSILGLICPQCGGAMIASDEMDDPNSGSADKLPFHQCEMCGLISGAEAAHEAE